MNKFYFMYPSGDVVDIMFQDVTNFTRVDSKSKKPNGLFGKILKKIHLSRKINSIIRLPFKMKWYDLKDLGMNSYDQYHVFVFAATFLHMDINMLNKVFKKENIHPYLILLDPIDSNTPVPKITRKVLKKINFEKIYSYDKIDAQRNNFIYMDEHLYTNDIKKYISNGNPEYDLYFLGRFKSGRGQLVFDFYQHSCDKVNFECKMQITKFGIEDANINELKFKDGIKYFTNFINYETVIMESSKSNCILELIQDTYSDTTLRYFEAVIMNKKLLTNNKNIVNLRYYNPKYMHYFENLNDIDFDWVKRNEPVDYGYKGDFSTKIFFDEIVQQINLEQGNEEIK